MLTAAMFALPLLAIAGAMALAWRINHPGRIRRWR